MIEKCPVCGSIDIKKAANTKTLVADYCLNCASLFIPKENSFIEETKQIGKAYTWNKELLANASKRDILVKEAKQKLCKLISKAERPIKTVIDFGCGPGILVQAAQELGLHAIGIENDQLNADFCKKMNLNVVQGDFNKSVQDINWTKIKEFGDVLCIFQNSLIYNTNILGIFELVASTSSAETHIYVEDQTYFWSIYDPIAVLNSNKTSFILSPKSLPHMLQQLGFRTIYLHNAWGKIKYLSRLEEKRAEERNPTPNLNLGYLDHFFYKKYAKELARYSSYLTLVGSSLVKFKVFISR